MCTSYPSCHRTFGFRQSWESFLLKSPSLPSCKTLKYSGTFYYDSRTTLGKIPHALHNELWFLSRAHVFTLVDITEIDWEGKKKNNL